MAFETILKRLRVKDLLKTGSLVVDNNLDIAGDVDITGDLTVTGDFDFGDAGTDTLTVDGSIVFAESGGSIIAGATALNIRGGETTGDALVLYGSTVDTNQKIVITGASGTAVTGAFSCDGNVTLSNNTCTITHSGTTSLTITSTSGTVAVEGVTFTGAALSGVSTIGMNGNFTQSGATTFGTGTGAISLNGDVTIAAGKTLNISGAGTDGIIISGAMSDNGIEISGVCSGAAMQVTGVNTGSILDITGVWGQGFTQAALNIGGAAAIAFGSCADQLVLARYNITAQVGTAEGYVIGEYKNYATSGAGAGTVLQHGIWMGDYCGLDIGHDTTDAYATRGRTGITGTIEGNQFIGVMGQVDFTGAATLEDTGGGYGVYGSLSSSGSGTCNRNVAAGYFTMKSNTINLAGTQSAVVADLGGSGYADYGFLAQVGNNNVAEAAIGVVVTDGSILPSAIKFHIDGGNSITHAFEFDAANTAASAESGTTPAGDGIIIAVDYNGTTLYLRAVSAWT